MASWQALTRDQKETLEMSPKQSSVAEFGVLSKLALAVAATLLGAGGAWLTSTVVSHETSKHTQELRLTNLEQNQKDTNLKLDRILDELRSLKK